jgi:hypothetical protein
MPKTKANDGVVEVDLTKSVRIQIANEPDPLRKSRMKAIALNTELENATELIPEGRLSFSLSDGSNVTIEEYGIGELVETPYGMSVERRQDSSSESLWVRINIDGSYPNGDGWYGFTNPPIRVPDGTSSDVIEPLSGTIMSVPVYKEDLLLSIKTIIAHALGGEL